MAEGLAIVSGTRVTRLKWHRLRRGAGDPEFGPAVLAEGFALGASMEVDLNIRGDGGFVVLHDATLDRETTGRGAVASLAAADLAGVVYRQSGLPLILSEGLAGLMGAAHPQALLQFDMKDDLAGVGARGLDHLAEVFGSAGGNMIFSGACADLIRALGARLPQVARGIDPTDRLVEVLGLHGITAVEPALLAELRGGAAPDTCYLNWQLVLEAARLGLDMIALCHAEGVKVDAWTFPMATPDRGFSAPEWEAFAALMALGPDQITTDHARAVEAAWLAR